MRTEMQEPKSEMTKRQAFPHAEPDNWDLEKRNAAGSFSEIKVWIPQWRKNVKTAVFGAFALSAQFF